MISPGRAAGKKNGRHGRAWSGQDIRGKKISVGKKALEFGWSIEQTGSRQQGSVWNQQKFGKGGTGECSAQIVLERRAQEVTTYKTEGEDA